MSKIKYQTYCLSFNNNERKKDMEERFKTIGIDCIFYEGVSFEDLRIKDREICDHTKKVWSCMYGHLDMIYNFYHNSDKEYGIFCEDDIYIHKDFANIVYKLIEDTNTNTNQFDIILLGYLLGYKLEFNHAQLEIIYQISDLPFFVRNYPFDLWGTQMYMISRSFAKILLDKYYHTYADQTIVNKSLIHFSADWTITKNTTKRALVYPPLAVENGKYVHQDHSQHILHYHTYLLYYDPNYHL